MDTKIIFDTTDLLKNVENVMQIELNKIYSDFSSKYKLYEKTYQAVMNLPCLKEECIVSQSKSSNDEVQKLDAKVNLLTNDIENIKTSLTQLCQLVNSSIDFIKPSKAPNDDVIIKVEQCEKENVKLIIEENLHEDSCGVFIEKKEVTAETNEEEEEDEKEEEEEDEEEEEEASIETETKEEDEQEEVEEEEQEEEASVETETKEEVDEQEEVEEEEEASVETETKEEEEQEEEASVETETKEEEQLEEEEELFEIEIDDITYCTNDEVNGVIYELKDGDVGDKVGYFKDSEPFFYADEK
jgi:hypothetical protein